MLCEKLRNEDLIITLLILLNHLIGKIYHLQTQVGRFLMLFCSNEQVPLFQRQGYIVDVAVDWLDADWSATHF